MSYILDALQRADAERDRGAAPGLHSRQAWTAAPARGALPRGGWGHWGRAVAVLMAGLVAAAGYWAWRQPSGPPEVRAEARPVPPARAVEAAATPPAPAAPAAADSVALQAVALPARQQVHRVVAGTPAAPHPAMPTGRVRVAAAARAAPSAPGVAPALPASSPARAAKPPAEPAAAAAAGTPAVPLKYSELPPGIRQQIPELNVSGVVYAESSKEWILLVNDRLLTRGSSVTPDVRVEEVGASSAIFSFRGTRFRVDL